MERGSVWRWRVVGLVAAWAPLAMASADPATTAGQSGTPGALLTEPGAGTLAFGAVQGSEFSFGAAREELDRAAAGDAGHPGFSAVPSRQTDGAGTASPRGEIPDYSCPAGTVFGQGTSFDVGLPAQISGVSPFFDYTVYDNFQGLTDKIGGISWWGLLVFPHETGGWSECADPAGALFEIRFYADDNGEPGEVIQTYTNVSPIVTDLQTDEAYGYAMYAFEVAELTPCCALTDGWVSIKGVGGCVLGWPGTIHGDGDAYQFVGSGIQQLGQDLPFCLLPGACPTVTGACCDRYTGGCQSDVEEAACQPPLQFTPNVSCGDLNPPCGITGACCDGAQSCLFTGFESECDTAGGVFYAGQSCASFTCPDDCLHRIELYDCEDDGWNGNALDVLVNGTPVLTAITLPEGEQRTYYFRAGTGDTIETVYHDTGSEAYEPYYRVYGGTGSLLAVDGWASSDCYVQPSGVSVLGDCDSVPQGACCHLDNTCELVANEAECVDGEFLGLGSQCEECPCYVTCPPEAVQEVEVCGEDTNHGCMGPLAPAFESIAGGDVVCGSLWTTSEYQDNDWYQITTTEYFTFTFEVEAEMPIGIMIFRANGHDDCTAMNYMASADGVACTPVSATTACLEPGTYWFLVYAAAWGNNPCPVDYVATLTAESCEAAVCPASGYSCEEYISRVQVGTIDNESGCTNYGDYKDLSTDLAVGTPVEMIVTVGGTPFPADYCRVWIDYNRDLQLDDTESIGIATGTGPYHFTIVPPANTPPGPTVMRVRLTYNMRYPAPCGVSQFGEVEDYTVNIVPVLGACCYGPNCVNLISSDCFGYWAGPGSECGNADCNTNGWTDVCEISANMAQDCNGNNVPDECEPYEDCNNNGTADFCDLANGTSQDCNGNTIPDECDITDHYSEDCNYNGRPDECDIIPYGFHRYDVDDGGHEDDVGRNTGGYVVWMNHFQVAATGLGRIGAVEIAYGMMPVGSPLTVYVWSDPNQDGNPQDATVLAQAATVVTDPATDVFHVVDIPDVIVGPGGTHFFVGAIIEHASGHYPCWIDTTTPMEESWLGADNDPLDPNNLAAALVALDHVEAYGLAGNWGIRTAALLGGDYNDNAVLDDCDVCGDLDGDDDVDYDDYVIFLEAFGGPSNSDPAADLLCDFNASGAVGMADYAAWLGCYRDFVGDPLAGPPSRPVPGVTGWSAIVNTDRGRQTGASTTTPEVSGPMPTAELEPRAGDPARN